MVKSRLAGRYAKTAAAATQVVASEQGFEIDTSQVQQGAWHPLAFIRGHLWPGFFDCCAA